MKKIIFIFSALICVPCFANDCLSYKITPTVDMSLPEYETNIVISKQPLERLHGHVSANLINNYELVLDMYPNGNGFCVILKKIDAVFGFDKFDVEIDREHQENSCTYNAVLNHEQKHIDTYLNIIEDFKSEIKHSLSAAADSVMPIFIEKESDIDTAFTEINQEFRAHPDLLLVAQKVNAAQEIRNKQIDQNENNSELFSCYN